jgi:hypothetical protein
VLSLQRIRYRTCAASQVPCGVLGKIIAKVVACSENQHRNAETFEAVESLGAVSVPKIQWP